MRLFEIDENHQVRPNRQWIDLIPEFKILLTRDKGSKGDSDGRKKLRARAELAYIYFFMDFGSPIRDWEPEEKAKEALHYSGLEEEDLKDKDLQAAIAKYQELQYKNARSLRSFNSMNKGLDGLDKHMETVDFTKEDKKGEQVHDPNKHAALIERMVVVYAKMREFEKFVEDDLKKSDDNIQGKRTLGDQEVNRNPTMSKWSEEDVRSGSAHRANFNPDEGPVPSGATFSDLQKEIHKSRPNNFTKEELDAIEDADNPIQLIKRP